MQYKDLKEMKIRDWDGNEFAALCSDNEDVVVCDGEISLLRGTIRSSYENAITGYDMGDWLTKTGKKWKHVYPIACNSLKPRRMTNRQLAEWCAKGKGLYKYGCMYVAYSSFTLDLNKENETVDEDISVRLIGSEEWVEPTVNLL